MAERDPSATRAWFAYSALRLLFFGVPLLAIWGLSRNLVLSAVLAAVVGFCLSVVLLDRQRGAVAVRLERALERRRPSSDEAAEDDRLDGGQGATSAAARPKP